MPIIPVFTFIAGAVLAGPLGRRVLPVTKAVGQAGVSVATAVLTGAGGVAFAFWHGQPHQDAPAA
jgi:hypothetical protein